MRVTGRFAALIAAAVLGLAACTNPTGEQYTGREAGRVLETDRATVISSRAVKIRGGENTGIGAVAGGAAAGSVASAAVDKPGAEAAATIISALVGAGLGFLVEEEARSRDGIEYVLRTRDDRVITIVQNRSPNEEMIPKGKKVLIQFGSDYTRVVPLPEDAQETRPRDAGDGRDLTTEQGGNAGYNRRDEGEGWGEPID